MLGHHAHVLGLWSSAMMPSGNSCSCRCGTDAYTFQALLKIPSFAKLLWQACSYHKLCSLPGPNTQHRSEPAMHGAACSRQNSAFDAVSERAIFERLKPRQASQWHRPKDSTHDLTKDSLLARVQNGAVHCVPPAQTTWASANALLTSMRLSVS